MRSSFPTLMHVGSIGTPLFISDSMASNEAVLVENAISKLYYLQFITIGISTERAFSTGTVSFEAIEIYFI